MPRPHHTRADHATTITQEKRRHTRDSASQRSRKATTGVDGISHSKITSRTYSPMMPFLPYASLAGITTFAMSPVHNCETAFSKPGRGEQSTHTQAVSKQHAAAGGQCNHHPLLHLTATANTTRGASTTTAAQRQFKVKFMCRHTRQRQREQTQRWTTGQGPTRHDLLIAQHKRERLGAVACAVKLGTVRPLETKPLQQR